MELRPIRTESDYRAALKEIEGLFDTAAHTPEFDRLDILSTLVAAYETVHFPIEKPDPIEAIYYYMDALGLSRQDLEKYFGNQETVSEVLSRKRALTLEMIQKLNQALGIPAEILIQQYQPVKTLI
jgi:HTH-type transcriptional regulator / antitoxin HigA